MEPGGVKKAFDGLFVQPPSFSFKDETEDPAVYQIGLQCVEPGEIAVSGVEKRAK